MVWVAWMPLSGMWHREPSRGAASVLPPDWGDGHMGVHILTVIYSICTDYIVIKEFNITYIQPVPRSHLQRDIIDLGQVLGRGVSHALETLMRRQVERRPQICMHP